MACSSISNRNSKIAILPSVRLCHGLARQTQLLTDDHGLAALERVLVQLLDGGEGGGVAELFVGDPPEAVAVLDGVPVLGRRDGCGALARLRSGCGRRLLLLKSCCR